MLLNTQRILMKQFQLPKFLQLVFVIKTLFRFIILKFLKTTKEEKIVPNDEDPKTSKQDKVDDKDSDTSPRKGDEEGVLFKDDLVTTEPKDTDDYNRGRTSHQGCTHTTDSNTGKTRTNNRGGRNSYKGGGN